MPRFTHISMCLLVACASAFVSAQDDETPLGDIARQLKNSQPPDQSVVIDNDNFNLLMDKAESERLEGQPVFAISHSGRTFAAVSPDGTCSLSFDGKSTSRTPAAYIASDLPQDELLKLRGPASLENGNLEVSLHNGTQWELKEIVVGITVVQTQSAPAAFRFATLASSAAASAEKTADLTMLYHLKGSGAPDSTTIFRGPLEASFSEGTEWHWAIVGARGVPPAGPAALPQSLTSNNFPPALKPRSADDKTDLDKSAASSSSSVDPNYQ